MLSLRRLSGWRCHRVATSASTAAARSRFRVGRRVRSNMCRRRGRCCRCRRSRSKFTRIIVVNNEDIRLILTQHMQITLLMQMGHHQVGRRNGSGPFIIVARHCRVAIAGGAVVIVVAAATGTGIVHIRHRGCAVHLIAADAAGAAGAAATGAARIVHANVIVLLVLLLMGLVMEM